MDLFGIKQRKRQRDRQRIADSIARASHDMGLRKAVENSSYSLYFSAHEWGRNGTTSCYSGEGAPVGPYEIQYRGEYRQETYGLVLVHYEFLVTSRDGWTTSFHCTNLDSLTKYEAGIQIDPVAFGAGLKEGLDNRKEIVRELAEQQRLLREREAAAQRERDDVFRAKKQELEQWQVIS